MSLKTLQKSFIITLSSLFVLAEPCLSAAESAPVIITRDSFGVPTIEGGDFGSICRAIGQVYAEDRLWQMFEADIAANGRLAQYIPASTPEELAELLESDVFQRTINPTDAEVQEQIDKYFTKRSIVAFTNYVQGLNDIVAQVNDGTSPLPYEFIGIDLFPIPEFTLYDILRTARYDFQSFSPSQLPEYQLNNLVSLSTWTAEFGATAAYALLNDLDPLSSMIESQTVMVPNKECKKTLRKQTNTFVLKGSASADPKFGRMVKAAHRIGTSLKKMKKMREKYSPTFGSNGQAIAPSFSANGHALLRMAPQVSMNFPSDFYEVRIDNGVFTSDNFTLPGFPFGIGAYNQFAISAQVGHLPTNDFLFESTDNIISTRYESIYIFGDPTPMIIPVSRSRSLGWVIANPAPDMPAGTMLTLRSSQINSQLKGLNVLAELPFIHDVDEFIDVLKNPGLLSDIIGFQGQIADSKGNIAAYQATLWTKLPRNFDRRLPQGIIVVNPAATNQEYINGISLGQHDKNTKQGYYVGWNSLFDKDAEGSGDTIGGGGPGINRAYWLEDAIKSKKRFSFQDLKNLTVTQAVANSVAGLVSSFPTSQSTYNFGADLFTPLFKKRFFCTLLKQKHLTPDQIQTLELLKDYEGKWLEGHTAEEIANTSDVSSRFILANTWLLNFAGRILNPYVLGTQFEVNTGGVGDPLPSANVEGFDNNLLFMGQGNLLARLLGTNCDNSVFFPNWLEGVDVNQAILDSLDDALTNLGGFAAFPWGLGERPYWEFDDAILSPTFGPFAVMKTFNASGLYMALDMGDCDCGIERAEAIIPLGESGLVTPGAPPYYFPVFAPNTLDQFPLYTQFQLRDLPIFRCSK